MQSELPKVLVEVAGRPMIQWVLDALRGAGVENLVAVVGYRSDLVRERLASERGLRFAEQREQLGTGHAVMMCREMLAGHDGPVLVVTGDSPLTQRGSLQKLLVAYREQTPACLLGTAYKDDPAGLGRIVRDAEGEFQAIVEERDATEIQRQVREVNMSTYVFRGPELLWSLSQLKPENAQGEYYITDCPGLLKRAGKLVQALPVLEPCEALSINTPDERLAAEQELLRQAGTSAAVRNN